MPLIQPPRALHGHEMLRQSAISGGSALVAGSTCLLLAAFIIGVAADSLPFEAPPPNVSRWLVALVAVVFAVPGVWLVVSGLGDRRRQARVARGIARDPGSPWAWDGSWKPDGTHDDGLDRLLRGWPAVLGVALFLVPFNALVLTESESLLARAIIGLLDLFLLLSLGTMESETRLMAYECFREELSFDPLSASNALAGAGLLVSFDLPEAPQLATNSHRWPLRYWRLELNADLSGIDLEKRYPLPVY